MHWWTWLLAASALLSAQAHALEFRSFSQVEQDSTGVVWAIGAADDAGNNIFGLFSLKGSARRLVMCPGAPVHAYAIRLTKLRSGEVLCAWYAAGADNAHKFFLSRHQGDNESLLGEITSAGKVGEGFRSPSRLLEDSRGQVWLFAGGSLWRVKPGGAPELMRRFAESDLTSPLDKAHLEVSGIELVEDGAGRLWVYGLAEWPGSITLSQPHVNDGEGWRTVKAFEGLPDRKIAQMVMSSPNHFWCTPHGGGLYEVDAGTLQSRAVPEPEPGAFRWVHSITKLHDTMLVATFTAAEDKYPTEMAPLKVMRRTTALWRWKEGKWTKLVDGFEDDLPIPGAVHLDDHQILLGRIGGGLWRIRQDGDRAVRLDWRHGIELASVRWIFAGADAKLLLIDPSGRGAGGRMQEFSLRDREVRHPMKRLEIFRLRIPMVQDQAGGLWRVPLNVADRVEHYHGAAWQRIDLPSGYTTKQVSQLAVDSLARIWLLPDDSTQKTAVFDPARKAWEVFASLEAAYEAQLPRRAEFHLDADWLSPRYSKDGRITFSHPRDRLHYFDGSAWESGDRLLRRDDGNSAIIRPFFNRSDRLAWSYHSHSGEMVTREFHESGEWQQAAFDRSPIDPSWEPAKVIPLPRGAVTDKPASHVHDRLGSSWLVHEHRLYRALPGVCTAIFQEGEPTPFLDGRSLDAVFTTSDGDVFLLSDEHDRAEYLHLRFDPPLPDTTVQVKPTGVDAVQLEIKSDTIPPRWFRWRLGGMAWSDPVPETSISLESIPGGEHRCEVATLDQWLRPDPTPAVVTVKIEVAEAERVATLIRQLDDPDYVKREEAVRRLARYPKHALPALRAARIRVRPDSAWWLDAAIQESERASGRVSD